MKQNIMKRKALLTLLFVFALVGMTMAQSPEAVNYQAVARDASGALLASTPLDVNIKLFEGYAGQINS